MYTGQVTEIKTMLSRHPKLKDVEVQTVNQYQRRENKIIIISLVRTTPTKSEFLRDPGRINVALTRQTHGLVIVGDLDNFKRLQDKNHEGKMVDSIWGSICNKMVSVMGQLVREDKADKPPDNTETIHAVTESQLQRYQQMGADALDAGATAITKDDDTTKKDEAEAHDKSAIDGAKSETIMSQQADGPIEPSNFEPEGYKAGAPGKLKWTNSRDNWYHAERAVLEGNCKAITAMQRAGLDVNTKLTDGETPLIQLARKDDMITHLIGMKADVNATNAAGWTLLKRLTM